MPAQPTFQGRPPERNLLRRDAVTMTVLAQDPTVRDARGPVLAGVPVPADRLQRGPCNHRLHVVDGSEPEPVVLHDGDPWTYRDRWAVADDLTPEQQRARGEALAGDREFRAQHVFAVAAHTLALFERHLGRPIAWQSGLPHLELAPDATVGGNAAYSRREHRVGFGWLPANATRPEVHTALSYDVVAHEVSHAVLDGLRPRYTQAALPDQLAFHEALADLVALFSVFGLDGVAEHLLDPDGTGAVDLGDGTAADPGARARRLMTSPLVRLAEQLGGLRRTPAGTEVATDAPRYPALRSSLDLEPGEAWHDDPAFAEPHRRAEVLVAAFLHTFVQIWARRLQPLQVGEHGLDAARVAEEGTKAAGHLLAMLLRALDYLPPVQLELADVVDSVLTADRRLVPDDDQGYRDLLEATFARFGITPPVHHIVDEDGAAAPSDGALPGRLAASPPDPDAVPDAVAGLGLRYEHLNFAAMRTSPEEVYQFVWSNATFLELDVRMTTRVERVLSSTRVGPDGLVVTEILADYTQVLRTTAGALPEGIARPAGLPDEDVVELWGGGVLVFDQFGRFRLHQRQPVLDADRQSRLLAHLVASGLRGKDGWGTVDPVQDAQGLSRLHPGSGPGVEGST